ncbi:hypothetical protein [Campylobacter troglodytis]|uniref:hypothetical protein n=1 Tax=Campylobacter troglodytis TaxID=654363 RepID=UPI00115B9CD4|nr:hypothetical protein [Campylobacter troglodytis]TQR60373.1 hypothetical protein DMC01_06105 [Campylobacter troglodytis]
MKYLNKTSVFTVLVVASLFSACATISNQPSQRVNFNTNTGDSVTADINGAKVKLPGWANISRSSDTVVKILPSDNPGYEATELLITGKQSVSSWFWGNIIFGGLPGSTTDGVTGAMWEYSNPNFVVPVKKVGSK